MKTYLQLEMAPERTLPSRFAKDAHVRYPENLVRYLLREMTKEGDVVLDPFAGFGTTLAVADEMGRCGYGVEKDEARADYARSLLEHPERLLVGDSSQSNAFRAVPAVALSLSSPPYFDYPELGPTSDEYVEYIDWIALVYRQVASTLRPGGRLVIEMSNLKSSTGVVTTQAWDIAHRLRGALSFEGEIVIGWSPTYCCGYDHSYCLVFAPMGPM